MAKKTDDEWRAELDGDRYQILRQGGTEVAFSGKYWDEKAPGVYKCAGCGQPLYTSDAKYDSGSGWPSFWEAVEKGAIEQVVDDTGGVRRTELRCSGCGGHLGHVFQDGPKPSGERHCINSTSLDLEPSE